MHRRRLGSLLFAAALGTSASAADLVFGAFDFAPYFNVDQESFELTGGLWAEHVGQIFAEAGLPYVSKGYPTRRLFKNIASGETNLIFGTRNNPEYAGKALFSKEPVELLNLNLYYLDTTAPADGVEALSGKSLLVIRGYSYDGLINSLRDPANHIAIQEIASDEGGLNMLASGRANYFLDYAEGVAPSLAAHPMPGLEHHMIAKVPIYMVLSKATPDAEEVMRRLDEAYSRLPRK